MHSASKAGLRPTPRFGRQAERVRDAVRRALAVVRQIIGAPDYQRYLEHHRACHPGSPPLTPREHYAQFIAGRYGSGVSRCC
jgi:uncharacterized short protein YbdD (DUF466 family)